MFDSFVPSLLTYGYETLLNENLLLKFCETVLVVRHTSCYAALCEELGKYPLNVNIYIIRLIKYFFKSFKNEKKYISPQYCNEIISCANKIKRDARMSQLCHRSIVNIILADIQNNNVEWFSDVKEIFLKYMDTSMFGITGMMSFFVVL